MASLTMSYLQTLKSNQEQQTPPIMFSVCRDVVGISMGPTTGKEVTDTGPWGFCVIAYSAWERHCSLYTTEGDLNFLYTCVFKANAIYKSNQKNILKEYLMSWYWERFNTCNKIFSRKFIYIILFFNILIVFFFSQHVKCPLGLGFFLTSELKFYTKGTSRRKIKLVNKVD